MNSLLINIFSIGTAISIHEFSHACMSNYLGDPTAKHSGRLTLNPIVHLNPLGLLMMVIAGIGFANPVPINSNNFNQKTRKRDLILVSLAGALGNVIASIICALLMHFLTLPSAKIVLFTLINYNLSFAAFNLIPIIPPLDGWQILKQIIPYRYYSLVYKYESMSMIIFLFIMLTNVHLYLMTPILALLNKITYFFI